MDRTLAFLAEASEALASSLDYEQTLREVARLAIPVLGDMCIVDVVDEGELRRVATAHVSATKVDLLDELRRRFPPSSESPHPAARVLRSGHPELLPVVTPDIVAEHTRSAEHAQLIRTIGVRSHLSVPLVARGATFGTISLGITESDRQYGERDLALALDLARRAALAVDNARLYRAAQQELAERRRIDQALRLSEARFRAVVEQSPLSMQIFSADGTPVRCNRAWEQLWGVTLDEIPEYNVLRDPELAAHGIDIYIRRAFAGEATEIPAVPYDPERSIPNRSRHADPVRRVRAFAYPIKDEEGAVREVVLVHEDVTARVQAEEQLRVLADAGETLGGSLDSGAILQNFAKVVVPRLADWCAVDLIGDSGALERVSVYHPDARRVALAQELFHEFPPRRSDPHGAWQVIRRGVPEWAEEIPSEVLEAVAHDAEHLRRLRELHMQSYVCVPLVARGVIIGVLTLVHAESGRRYREADVALATDLARRAAAAVENARLYQRLREEDRRKDEFLATLAHELRNPLAPLRSGLDVLRMSRSSPATETTDAMHAMMERQLAHMVRLVDDLLDVSRVTRGKIGLHLESLDVGALVSSALEVSQAAIVAAGLSLTVRLPDEPITIRGDRTRLAQVLSNLLNNAAKYTAPGGEIEVSAGRTGGELVVRVSDTGAGIPREMLEAVFDMFVQVDRSQARGEGGLGIGLTLVRQLVELHGGRVWAESEGRGRGSTFCVTLPAQASSSEPVPELRSAPRVAPPLASRRILVVDDNADAAETLSLLLTLDGHEVQSAASGAGALERVRTFRPEIAFLDIGLPGMSGYELAQRLRSDAGLTDMTLVAVTGWGQEEDRRLSREAGFDHHLTKPVETRDVRRVIAELGARG